MSFLTPDGQGSSTQEKILSKTRSYTSFATPFPLEEYGLNEPRIAQAKAPLTCSIP